nr:MAG TPA: hypothetical protein [Caudoviricetes sp.]
MNFAIRIHQMKTMQRQKKFVIMIINLTLSRRIL